MNSSGSEGVDGEEAQRRVWDMRNTVCTGWPTVAIVGKDDVVGMSDAV